MQVYFHGPDVRHLIHGEAFGLEVQTERIQEFAATIFPLVKLMQTLQTSTKLELIIQLASRLPLRWGNYFTNTESLSCIDASLVSALHSRWRRFEAYHAESGGGCGGACEDSLPVLRMLAMYFRGCSNSSTEGKKVGASWASACKI